MERKRSKRDEPVLKRVVTDVPPIGPGDIASRLPELTGETSEEADDE